MKKIFGLSAICLAIAFICTPFLASASGGAAPIDSGLSLIIAAVVSYIAKKLAANRQQHFSRA